MELQKNEDPPQHAVNLLRARGDSQSKPADSAQKSLANKRNILIVVSDLCCLHIVQFSFVMITCDEHTGSVYKGRQIITPLTISINHCCVD